MADTLVLLVDMLVDILVADTLVLLVDILVADTLVLLVDILVADTLVLASGYTSG